MVGKYALLMSMAIMYVRPCVRVRLALDVCPSTSDRQTAHARNPDTAHFVQAITQ